jgi:hypothetical protein
MIATKSYTDMFGNEVTVPVRGKHYVEPRGYWNKPGTGPAGETCGSCRWIDRHRRWAKCGKARVIHTGGRGTDILVRSPACSGWEANEE